MDRIERALERSRRERHSAALAPAAVASLPATPSLREVASSPATPGVASLRSTGPRTRRVPVDGAAVARAGLVTADLTGPVGHSMKLLRTMVLQRLQKHGWNSLAVLGPGAADGASFVAANLAIAVAAEHNLTSLLVDLDLRAPTVHRRFGVEPSTGIERCLAGQADIADALLAPEEYPGLVLLPAATPVAASSELLGGQRAAETFRELKQRYVNRIVVYDLPPVLAGDDALVFVPRADAVLVVVGENRTRREDLVRCLELLRHLPVLGTVLNGAVQRADTTRN